MASFLFPSLRGYQGSWLRSDLVAGLTVWAILIPEALAYASIAGVSPVVGLYAAPGALILYAALGSSRALVVGPMAATAALSAATVGDLVAHSSGDFLAFTTALAITTGAAALIAGVLRLGFLASFISEPVLKGFIVGLALTIIIGQVPKLFGVDGGEGDFFRKAAETIGNLGETSGITILVGGLSLALVLGLKRWNPAIPASLVAVAAGIAVVHVFSLDDHGLEIVGHVDSGLPSLGGPGLALHDYGRLAAGGIGVMLVGFAEGLGAAKTYSARDHYEIDPNRELLGLGGANLAAGLSGGMVVNGSLSKTAVNASAGARTQLAGLLVAGLTVLTLLFLTGLFEDLPEATLAAIVIAAVVELVDFPALRGLYRVYSRELGRDYGFAARPDFIAATAAMLGVLVFDTLPGLFIGIGVALLLLLYRASRPYVAELGALSGEGGFGDLRRHPEARPVAGAAILRIESGLFFANADAVRTRIEAAAAGKGVKLIVLDLESVPSLDVSAARMLEAVTGDLGRAGVELRLARAVGQTRDVLAKAGGEDGALEVHRTIDDALADRRAGD
ncbi:MAG TPA: SulP family inorganic anion transporter [Solirubrobacterales bacterium]|jgi:high affinity sulfate transporter 1|nr:SulP family inorganic anion transporter [Solirubrobacterales bacterium]